MGWRAGLKTVQRCKSEQSSCAKVQRRNQLQVTGDGHGRRQLRNRLLGHQPRDPEPAAEGRTADSRKADAPMAVTCHLIFGSYFCTFAQAAGGLHFCTYVVTRSRPYPLHSLSTCQLVNGSTGQLGMVGPSGPDHAARINQLLPAELRQGEVVGVVAHCGDQSKAGVFV